MRGVFNLVLDAKGKKVVESESHDLRTGEGGLLKRDGVSGPGGHDRKRKIPTSGSRRGQGSPQTAGDLFRLRPEGPGKEAFWALDLAGTGSAR